nr:MAG TPA: hypothetical protein [Caudoviricetes sp.]
MKSTKYYKKRPFMPEVPLYNKNEAKGPPGRRL